MSQPNKVKTLLVTFDAELAPEKVSAFRGAVIEKVGRSHSSFHNHAEGDGFLYKYPVIQYKIIHNRPSFFCVGEGVDQIHHFFGLKSWDVVVHGEKLNMTIYKLDLNQCTLNVWDKKFNYSIRNWLALNAENYKAYQTMSSLKEKIGFLEKKLTGNILSFAKGVDWHIEKQVQVEIRELRGQKMIRYKGVPLMAFDVNFKTNVFLPNYLGLGKSASHGFGVVKEIREHKNMRDNG